MKKNICSFLLVGIIFFVGFEAKAFETYNSRFSLFVHGRAVLQEDYIKLHAAAIFAEMQDGLSPCVLVGPQIKLSSWFTFEPKVAWNFIANEPSVGLAFMPAYGNFWTWGTVNMSLLNQNGYWFFQVEYNFDFWKNLLSIGLEGEGWGNYANGKRWSNGGGPTIDLRFKYFEFETSVQFRDYNQKAGAEFQVRVHAHLGE